MAYAKQMALVNKLIELTNVGAIQWKPSLADTMFQISLRDNTLRISLQKRANEPDVEIQLLNGDGDLVESFSDVDLQADSDGFATGGWYSAMFDIYKAARRKALGADKVLDEIMADLDGIGPF